MTCRKGTWELDAGGSGQAPKKLVLEEGLGIHRKGERVGRVLDSGLEG